MDALENSLIAKMSQMTTDDRDNLIGKFKEIIAPQTIPHDLAAFYMDLANWNLSTALSVFYDQNGDFVHMEEAFRQASLSSSVKECTQPEAISGNETFMPGHSIFCGFRVVNDGRFRWPQGTRLACVDGDLIDYEVGKDTVLDPDESEMVEMRFTCPDISGDYKARFQFVTPQNFFFGESIWIVLRVRAQYVGYSPDSEIPAVPNYRGLAVMPYQAEPAPRLCPTALEGPTSSPNIQDEQMME